MIGMKTFVGNHQTIERDFNRWINAEGIKGILATSAVPYSSASSILFVTYTK